MLGKLKIELPDTWVTQSGLWGGPQMPWKECNGIDERLRFVVRLLDGELSNGKQRPGNL